MSKRIRDDGMIWCPRCQAWKAPDDFSPAPTRNPPYRSRCRACSRADSAAYAIRRSRQDPAWYAAKVARKSNDARDAATARRRQEEAESMTAAIKFLRSRGLWVQEIAAICGVDEESLRRWQQGRGRERHIYEEVMRLYRCCHDVPPSLPHYQKRGPVHPHFAIISRRMALSREEFS